MSESDDSTQRDELREQLPWPADESYESEESDDDDIVRVGGATFKETQWSTLRPTLARPDAATAALRYERTPSDLPRATRSSAVGPCHRTMRKKNKSALLERWAPLAPPMLRFVRKPTL